MPIDGEDGETYVVLGVRFSAPDGTVTFDWTETRSNSPLDRSAHRLWESIRMQKSEVRQAMLSWLSDLQAMEQDAIEPF